jgi:protein translocase SecG subunit
LKKNIDMIALITTAIFLTLIILIQTPKGTNNKTAVLIGAKSSNRLLVKSTWIFGTCLFALTLFLA